jgi:hypothetical protein
MDPTAIGNSTTQYVGYRNRTASNDASEGTVGNLFSQFLGRFTCILENSCSLHPTRTISIRSGYRRSIPKDTVFTCQKRAVLATVEPKYGWQLWMHVVFFKQHSSWSWYEGCDKAAWRMGSIFENKHVHCEYGEMDSSPVDERSEYDHQNFADIKIHSETFRHDFHLFDLFTNHERRISHHNLWFWILTSVVSQCNFSTWFHHNIEFYSKPLFHSWNCLAAVTIMSIYLHLCI